MYIVRYLGSVLGTQCSYNKKTRDASLSVIFGVNVLSDHVIQFIQKDGVM